jgi:flagellar motor component MotA
MRFSILIGCVVFALACLYALTSASHSLPLLESSAFVLVFGGSLGALFVWFDHMQLKWFARYVRETWTHQPQSRYALASELLRISEAYRTRSPELDNLLSQASPFLNECVSLLRDGLVDESELGLVLRARVETQVKWREEFAGRLKSFAQVPTALGIVGALFALYQVIESAASGLSHEVILGAMTFGFVSLFYGIMLGTFVMGALSRNLIENARAFRLTHALVGLGCRLMAARSNAVLFAEELNSHLAPEDRINWKDVVSTRSAA